MVGKKYTPDRGDIVWVTFDPTRGHEQKGRRPAIVISPKNYNAKSGLLVCCPITSKVKGYPFEVPIDTLSESGVILVDQLKSLDWKVRKIEKISSTSPSVLAQVQQLICALIHQA